MIIETLKLHDFRNYDDLTLAPHPGVNILFGQNGSGKTNLLEAVHYCALGRSHRTSQDSEVVRVGRGMAAVGVQLRTKSGRMDVAVKLTPGESRHKSVFLDKKRAGRLSELMGHVRCVIFSPEDLMLVKEGPSVRRRYLDMMISQLSPAYFMALQKYQKSLEQRNALLRNARMKLPCDENLLATFEQAMAEACTVLLPLRREKAAILAEIASNKYSAISGKSEEIFAAVYRPCTDKKDIYGAVVEALQACRKMDILRGGAGFGPHREDIELFLNERPMKLYASQGQIRTAALALKLAQVEIFRRTTNDAPILLLDDVMSELDMNRRTRLLAEISGMQTFITCTDETDVQGCREKRSYQVQSSAGHTATLQQVSEGEAMGNQATDDVLDELDRSL